MGVIQKIIMKCKEQCHKFVTVFNDSHDYETAVERFMRGVEGQDLPMNTIIEEDDNNHQILYSAPNVSDETSVTFGEETGTEDCTECIEGMIDETQNIDNLLVSCEAITPTITLPEITKNSDEHLADEHLEDKNSFISSLVVLMDELDQLATKTNDVNVISTIEFCQNRITEILLSNECEVIDGDIYFDNARHIPKPFAIIPAGTEISATLRSGIIYNKKIILKALVEIKKTE